jgi:MFS family permease
VELIPRRLGVDFRRLLGTAWASDLGDGVALAAGPLLVLTQTSKPFLIALATLLQRLPWVVLGLQVGVLVDRRDRRLIILIANSARVLILALLSLSIVTDNVSVAVVLVSLTTLGTAEVFVDTTTSTLLPMIVDKDDLGIANSRLLFGRFTINRLGGPSIGAGLFALGTAVPFVVHAVCLTFAVALVRTIAFPASSASTEPSTRKSVRSDIAAGLRWMWHHRAIRTLTITIFAFNITYGAAWGVLVLYTRDRLRLSGIGFGALTSFGAAGGIVATLLYSRIESKLGMATIMRIGLLIETGMHLSLAVTRTPAIAFLVFFIFGMHEAMWGTTSSTIRQRAVPREFQGRVASVYSVGVFGSLVIGAFIGGAIASTWGVTGPFWFGFVGSAIILAFIWRQLSWIAN